MAQEMTWSNGRGSRGRMPWLLFVLQGEDKVLVFEEKNIPGVVAIRGSDYTKNGKWSHDTYRLVVADGVRAISGRSGWETGLFAEGIGDAVGKPTPDTWPAMAECLGVSVPAAMSFLRAWKPGAAQKIDQVEATLAALEEAEEEAAEENDTQIVTVSFGSPSNRGAREGYWEMPKSIPGYEAEIRLIDPAEGWGEKNITVVGIAGTVLSVTHSAGYHGGYYAVRVAIMPGTKSEIPAFETSREQAAKASGLPEDLFFAFNGDEEKIRQFMAKVAALDISRLDGHEMGCGRARRQAEVVRVSGDPDFFLGADPHEVCGYILGQTPSVEEYNRVVDAVASKEDDDPDTFDPDGPFAALGALLKE